MRSFLVNDVYKLFMMGIFLILINYDKTGVFQKISRRCALADIPNYEKVQLFLPVTMVTMANV